MVEVNNTGNATFKGPFNLTYEAWHKLEGHEVEKRYDAGGIFLSYLVSLVGAWTALELLNLRTTRKGRYNWAVLIVSSISMGGVAIWCMHYIGDHALTLGHGEPYLQVSYNTTSTPQAFLLPVVVFFMSFWAVGSHETVNIARVCMGGTLAGLGICGMHYLGQASISNYRCFYIIAYVVGSVLVAIAGCVVPIFLFFRWRAVWAIRWWKRGVCASILAFAVSGNHWLASAGTHYLLVAPQPPVRADSSRHLAIIVAIILTTITGVTHLILELLIHMKRLETISRSQKLSLFAAIFDKHGRVLITPGGTLPNRKIANSFIEGTMNDVFTISHPAFLWIFRTTRNWNSVKNIIPAMRTNIDAHCHHHRLRATHDVNLMDEDGEPIKDYSVVFRELFCIAAADIASDLHRPMEDLGCLFDEIISTGQKISTKVIIQSRVNALSDALDKIISEIRFKIMGGRRVIRRPRKDLEKDADGAGPGQILFLVKKVHRREGEALQAAGYRFGKIDHILPYVSNNMKIKPDDLVKHFQNMWDYANHDHPLEPGCHLACFAIRASIKGGFDVVVRKDARSQLPTMVLPFDTLEEWQIEFLKAMNTLNVTECQRFLSKAVKAKDLPLREKTYSNQLLTTLQALKYEIGDPIFSEACLIATPIIAPCRGNSDHSPPGDATLIAFRLIVPINTRRPPGKKCAFAPITLFKLRQRVHKNALDHSFFARAIYREFAPIFDETARQNSEKRRWRHHDSKEMEVEVIEEEDAFGNAITRLVTKKALSSRPSRLRTMWHNRPSLGGKRFTGDRNEPEVEGNAQRTESHQSMGGILVSSEVVRDVKKVSDSDVEGKAQGFDDGDKQGGVTGVTANVSGDVDPPTFVDELFKICVKNTAMPR
ncbi:MHYT domain signaling protein [Rutstroemia sp. NJR-2017a BBW]|nr:MHYT domain signaling protein [Rutstroemia sp. NJR-2017a BBW]